MLEDFVSVAVDVTMCLASYSFFMKRLFDGARSAILAFIEKLAKRVVTPVISSFRPKADRKTLAYVLDCERKIERNIGVP